jgi:uncharacterized membrane protein YkvA (DUF1232 family)
MLRALQNHLRDLAEDKTGKLKKEIEVRWGDEVTEDQVHAIKEFIFLMPPCLKVLSQYWSEKKTPAQAKNLAGLIITYVYHPHDLISDEEHGLFGYIDDAYLVVASFLRIQHMYIHDWAEKSELERDLIERAKELINAPKLVIPDEAAKIDDSITRCLDGKIEDVGALLASHD